MQSGARMQEAGLTKTVPLNLTRLPKLTSDRQLSVPLTLESCSRGVARFMAIGTILDPEVSPNCLTVQAPTKTAKDVPPWMVMWSASEISGID